MAIKRKVKASAAAFSVTVQEAFEDFIAEKEAFNLAPATIGNYKQSFDYFMQFAGFDDDTPLEEVTQSLFFHWINTLKLEGASISSINHYLRDCRTFFYWCMDEDRRYIEPRFKIQLLSQQEEAPKLFSDEELELLLAKPRRQDGFTEWRTWAIVNWVLGTGNRASTIVDVRFNHINFITNEITLHHTKNKKAQIIPLSSSLKTVLKEYIRIWRKDAAYTDSYLFCNIGDEKLTTNALRHSFSKYCAARGVDRTNIHGLRHNFAKLWIRNGGDTFKLQRILGHSSLDMTKRYVKLFAEDLKQDFDDFSPLDNLKKSQRRTQTVKRSRDY